MVASGPETVSCSFVKHQIVQHQQKLNSLNLDDLDYNMFDT